MSEAKYVVGFVFDKSMNQVGLIRKNKPAWQAGLLNGIGGKIELNETSLEAMTREANEEAGITECGWVNFCGMSGTNNDGSLFSVDFFYCVDDPHRMTSKESEKIEIHSSSEIASGVHMTIGNLPWLTALAIDFGKGVFAPKRVVAFY